MVNLYGYRDKGTMAAQTALHDFVTYENTGIQPSPLAYLAEALQNMGGAVSVRRMGRSLADPSLNLNYGEIAVQGRKQQWLAAIGKDHADLTVFKNGQNPQIFQLPRTADGDDFYVDSLRDLRDGFAQEGDFNDPEVNLAVNGSIWGLMYHIAGTSILSCTLRSHGADKNPSIVVAMPGSTSGAIMGVR